jgi:hypothetical protein
MPIPSSITRVSMAFTSAGDNTIVAAVTGKMIHIWKIAFTTHAGEIIEFWDGASASGTSQGAYEFTAAGSLVLDSENFPVFDASPGNAFVAKLTTGVAIKGTAWITLS